MPGTIRIGTSGWNYGDWKGRFYPADTKPDDFLRRYAEAFRTVEINNTFYNIPKERAVRSWRESVPEDFVFACKVSRYVTHMKKLKDPDAGLKRFFGAVETLGERLGPILFQLPPNWRVNPERLGELLRRLPSSRRYAFEFRDKSWFDRSILDLLKEHNAALCIYDLEGWQAPATVTADFTYVRLHGPERRYEGHYDGRTLAGWAKRFVRWSDDEIDVYCYFDNDQGACAPIDAGRLIEQVSAK